ncbi:MAG: hypothetical protein JST92_26780, partial [Deltaproteobacteria bacterium]|nr:hypothetical protein [Deltaproteobacteria bacterium]
IAMSDARDAMGWLDTFCVYQIAEKPGLASGHTFSPNVESPRRAFDRWPDHRHHPDDGRCNPFGIWRFHEPGVRGVAGGQVVLTAMPTYVSIVVAAERKKGSPLTRNEVEAVVAECMTIAMDPKHAAELERSRGYADLQPELAWEQWQIIRATL